MSNLNRQFEALHAAIAEAPNLTPEKRRDMLSILATLEKKKNETTTAAAAATDNNNSISRTNSIYRRLQRRGETTADERYRLHQELRQQQQQQQQQNAADAGGRAPDRRPGLRRLQRPQPPGPQNPTTAAAYKRAAAFDLTHSDINRAFKAQVDRTLAPYVSVRTLHKPKNLFQDRSKQLAWDPIKDYDDKWHQNHLLYSDSRYRVFVRRVSFTGMKNMSLKDYLFQMRVVDTRNNTLFKSSSGANAATAETDYSAPAIIDLLEQIWVAMRDCLREIQSNCDPSKENQVFICFHHGDFTQSARGRINNIETGNYALRSDTVDYITDQSMSLLEKCLQSRKEIRLDESFQVTIKVMAVSDRLADLQRQNILVGNEAAVARKVRNILANINHKTLMPVPRTAEFSQLCLPAACVLGYYKRGHSLNKLHPGGTFAEDARIYLNMEQINYSGGGSNAKGGDTKQGRNARKTLLERTKNLCLTLGYPVTGPFPMEEFLQAASNHYNVRFQVYSNMGSRRIYVYPTLYDPRQPQIFLYCEEYMGIAEKHVSLIRNIEAFNRKSGWICDHCGLLRRKYHWCKKKGVMCFGCRRFIGHKGSVYLDRDNVNTYCMRYPNVGWETQCDKCNIRIFSSQCLKRHTKKLCHNGFACKECGRYIMKKKKGLTIAQLKALHDCNLETCKICYEEYRPGEGDGAGKKNEHLCRMPVQKEQKLHRPLGFFDLECSAIDQPTSCGSCFDLEDRYASHHAEKVIKLQRMREQLEFTEIEENSADSISSSSQEMTDSDHTREFFRTLLNADTAGEDHIDWFHVSTRLVSIAVKDLRSYYFDAFHCTKRLGRKDMDRLIRSKLVEPERLRCIKHLVPQDENEAEVPAAVDEEEESEQDGHHWCNFAVLFFESLSHGNFNSIHFADPRMPYPNRLKEFYNVLQYPYLPEEVTDTSLNTSRVRKGASPGDKPSSSKTEFPKGFNDQLVPTAAILWEGEDEEEGIEDLLGGGGSYVVGEEGELIDPRGYFDDECAVDDDDDEADYEDDEPDPDDPHPHQVEEEEDEGGIPSKKRRFARRLLFGKEDLSEADIARTHTVDQLLLTILTERFRNYVFISHNGAGYDLQFLVKRMFQHGICCSVITRTSRLLKVHVPSLNLIFLDSILYLSGSLQSLTKAFGLKESKGHFPHHYNLVSSYMHGQPGDDRVGVPSVTYFHSFNDSAETRADKENFVAELERSNYKWVFTEELARYCILDVEILTKVCCKFLQQSYKFQQPLLLEKTRRSRSLLPVGAQPGNDDILTRKLSYLAPFSDPFLTLSSWVYGMWRHYVLPQYDVACVNDERGLNSVKTSRAEQEMALFLQRVKHPNETVHSVFTTPTPARFGKIIPDAYVGGRVNRTYAMHGCMDHIHKSQDCTSPNMQWALASDNPVNPRGVSYKELQTREMNHARILESKYSIPKTNQRKIWYCQWQRWKTASLDELDAWEIKWAKAVREFIAGYDRLRPRKRLIPREALRGGKVEAYMFWWSIASAPEGQQLYYIDYNSLYPSVACSEDNLFAIGAPEFLVSDTDLARLVFEDGQAYLLDADGLGGRKRTSGLLQAAVLPPRNLCRPFLTIRVTQQPDGKNGPKTEKSLSVLCRTCAEKMQKTPCRHDNPEDRCLVSTWTIAEIAYSLTIGYELIHKYESYAYTQNAPLFKSFLERFTKHKIQYNGFPKDVDTPEKRSDYVRELNEGMRWKPGDDNFILEEEVEDNPALRSFNKLAQNSLLGKLGQENSLKRFHLSVSSQKELDDLVFNRKDCVVKDFVQMSDTVAEVVMEKKPGLARAGNIKSNVVLASHITAYARIEMDKAMRDLERVGAVVYYTDTDSLVFTLPPGVKSPLVEGACLWQFKNEVPIGWKLASFYCLAPKLYEMTIVNEKTGETQVWTKVKGFTVTSAHQKEILADNVFQRFVDRYLENIDQSVSIGQWNIRSDKTRNLHSVISQKILKNNIFSKRVSLRGPDYRPYNNLTLPFGYPSQMRDLLLQGDLQ